MRRSRSLRFSAAAAAAALGVAAAITATVLPASAEPAGHVYLAKPGSDLRTLLRSLQPGDTLELEPGTYTNLAPGQPNPSLLRPIALHAGTAAQPITVTAADPADKPLLQGAVWLDEPTYWRVNDLRIQGTVKGQSSLTIASGNHWSLSGDEVFGAGATGALANVAVARVNPAFPVPTNWSITQSCVHDGGVDPARPGIMHEIYVTVGGALHGSITHNRLFDTPNGGAIKIGEAVGPSGSNISITNNTMFDNGKQVILQGDASDETVRGNLMVDSTWKLSDRKTTVAMYWAGVSGHGTTIANNYIFRATRPMFSLGGSGSSWTNGGGNSVRTTGPRFAAVGCTGLIPTTATAALYGAASNHLW
jgi:hypothetical protein